jgi:hypothetical protein
LTCDVPQSMTAGHRHDEVGGSHEGECRRHQTAAADKDGELRVSLARMKVPEPKDDEIVVRVDATPLNPSDIGLLFGPWRHRRPDCTHRPQCRALR